MSIPHIDMFFHTMPYATTADKRFCKNVKDC